MKYKVTKKQKDITQTKFQSLFSWVSNTNHPLSNIINCCKLKIHGDWSCAVHHIYREMNTAADALAAQGADLAPGIHTFDLSPTFLIDTLAADANGTSRPRLLLS